jgi:putative endonuclease
MVSAVQKIGYAVERQACNYLLKQGLQLVTTNYSCKAGEIDLVMRDGAYVVFVEVRYRASASHGGALESITKNKQRKIISAAKSYLVGCNLWEKVLCRFDVILVQPDALSSKDSASASPQSLVSGISESSCENICWLRDAFWAN